MSFLKEIEPLYQYVELALKGSGYPNKGIIEKISDIDYKLRQKERLRIYGNAKAEVYPTDLSCGACIRSMFTNVQRWVNIYTGNGETFKQKEERIKETARQMVGWTEKETVEFKGVPQKESLDHLKDLVVDLEKDKDAIVYASEGEVKILTTEVKLTGLDEDIKIDFIPSIKTAIKPVSKMKWGEFKTYCKELGLSVKGKKRAELEEELKAL